MRSVDVHKGDVVLCDCDLRGMDAFADEDFFSPRHWGFCFASVCYGVLWKGKNPLFARVVEFDGRSRILSYEGYKSYTHQTS